MSDQLCPGCPGDPNETCCKPELRVKVWMDKQKADMTEQKTEQKTLRDEFAMAALVGWVASAPTLLGKSLSGSEEHRVAMCAIAYEWADAMLTARTQEAA